MHLKQPSETTPLAKGNYANRGACNTIFCCLFVAIAATIGGSLALHAISEGGKPVPQPVAAKSTVSIQATVADPISFAKRVSEDSQIRFRLRRAVALARGISEDSVAEPVIKIESATDPSSSSDLAAHLGTGSVRIEFDEATPSRMSEIHHVEEGAFARSMAAAMHTEFPSQVKHTTLTLATNISTRCLIPIGLHDTFCRGTLATALRMEEGRIQGLIHGHLPTWIANVAVGYEGDMLVLQPDVTLSSYRVRNAFGSQPTHRLRCSFEHYLHAAMGRAAQMFNIYSGGHCIASIGSVHCTPALVDGPPVDTPCATADVVSLQGDPA